MTLLRESLKAPALNEAAIVSLSPIDPLVKAKSIISSAEGLDEEERERVASFFEERFGDAKVKEFLPIFAKRTAEEAMSAKIKTQQPAVSITEIIPAASDQIAEVSVPPRRGVLWLNPRNRGRKDKL